MNRNSFPAMRAAWSASASSALARIAANCASTEGAGAGGGGGDGSSWDGSEVVAAEAEVVGWDGSGWAASCSMRLFGGGARVAEERGGASVSTPADASAATRSANVVVDSSVAHGGEGE